MRKDFFHNIVVQPEDDVYTVWANTHDEMLSNCNVEAHFIERDEEDGLWGCTLLGDENRQLCVEGFESRDDLLDWLNTESIPTRR